MLNYHQLTVITMVALVSSVTVVILASGVLFPSRTILNGGTIEAVGVGVYWESSCMNNVTQISWGFLAPDENQSITVYVKNEGTVPITLNMTTEDWTPVLASTDFEVAWNREGFSVEVGEVLPTVLYLSVSPDVDGITTFSFNMVIKGI